MKVWLAVAPPTGPHLIGNKTKAVWEPFLEGGSHTARKDAKMKIVQEIKLSEFPFWAGAKDRAVHLTEKDFDEIEYMLEDINPNGWTDTAVNDLFWFDEDSIAMWLGYDSFEALEKARSEN